MWFFDAITAGFRYPTDPGRLQLFRIIFGTICTLRFALSIGQGGWHRIIPGSLSLHLAEQRFGPRRARLLAGLYRPALVIRTAAAVALTLGLLPRLSLLAVLAGATMELFYLRSPNAVRYTLLTGSCLLVAGDLGHGLAIEHTPSTANTWAQCLLVLITTDIYWNSAWQKLRSPQFRTGLYLAQWVHVLTQVREQLPYHRQFAVPGLIRRHLGNLSERDVRLWQMISTAVITAEITLPPALLVHATTPWAIALGIGIHTAFACLKPRQLITFSGLTVGTYTAFAL
ncbi:hypothetical protein ACFUEN_29630 [Streptomyces griseorubiginosus]|uniref:hypothetical protein n=1 Tax=Streptomyces TaxID=1883 RepID=UPI0033E92585